MNAPEKIRLTEFSHGGGCGCKIAPAILSEILSASPIRGLPKDLLVGTETADDAAVYRLNDSQALIATTDFFTPIVDDPYDFGRIAATNAISDVYAMGGRPIMALAIVGMPLEKLPVSAIRAILAGGESVCAAAGIPIAGGHSIDTLEPIYGLVALGLVHPDRVKRNSSAKAGDALVLGKPLGIGILSAALKKGKLSAAGYAEMIKWTTKLNTPGQGLADRRGRPRAHRHHRLRARRPSPRDLPRLGPRGGGELRRPADDSRSGAVGAGRGRHRRIGSQLERLWPRSRAAGRLPAVEAQPDHRSADQRRAPRRVRAGSGERRADGVQRRRRLRRAHDRQAGAGQAAPSRYLSKGASFGQIVSRMSGCARSFGWMRSGWK